MPRQLFWNINIRLNILKCYAGGFLIKTPSRMFLNNTLGRAKKYLVGSLKHCTWPDIWSIGPSALGENSFQNVKPRDHPENFGIYSQLDRKNKTCFLLFSMYMLPELNVTKSLSHSFHLQNSGILQAKMDQRGDSMKINFENLQM